jgi:hypothetical protein
MKKTACRILPILAVALVIAMVSGVAAAQDPVIGETFTTNYFSNNTTAGAPAATLRFTEHDGIEAHEECAMIYVYAADQQLAECCGCPVSYNGLVHENVQKDLLGNTLTRVIPNEGVIQIVSSVDTGICDPTSLYSPAPEIDSWTTHIQNKVGAAFPMTEDRGDEELLSPDEYLTLIGDCYSAQRLGSGAAVCTCNPDGAVLPKPVT